MNQIRAYRFRLYPNREQLVRLEATLETCRRTYNDALQARIEHYKETGKTLSYFDQCKVVAANKSEFQKAVHSHLLQSTLYRLNQTYKNFFEARKAGKASGFPRFKPRHKYNSFCFPERGFKLISGGLLRLSKIGDVRIVLHRAIEGTIKNCSIVRDVDEWYAVLLADIPVSQTAAELPGETVGVDVGIHYFAALSTGEVIANPRHLKRSEQKLARLQRRLARKKKGSANRGKARVKVAKCYQKVRRQRQDFLHGVSSRLTAKYGTIVFEKLSIGNMMKNHRLAKHISDAAWNCLINYTTYKAASAGGRVELVSAQGTSQTCSGCGSTVPKSLSVRVHSCPVCNLVIDRDVNAAINIKQRFVGQELTEQERGIPVQTLPESM